MNFLLNSNGADSPSLSRSERTEFTYAAYDRSSYFGNHVCAWLDWLRPGFYLDVYRRCSNAIRERRQARIVNQSVVHSQPSRGKISRPKPRDSRVSSGRYPEHSQW